MNKLLLFIQYLNIQFTLQPTIKFIDWYNFLCFTARIKVRVVRLSVLSELFAMIFLH